MIRYDFEAGNIYFDEGLWKGWALKSRLFWALVWQRAKRVPFGRSAFWAQKGLDFQGSPLSVALVIDLARLKTITVRIAPLKTTGRVGTLIVNTPPVNKVRMTGSTVE